MCYVTGKKHDYTHDDNGLEKVQNGFVHVWYPFAVINTAQEQSDKPSSNRLCNDNGF